MSHEIFDKIVQIVKEKMEEYHVPGIAIGIVDRDQTYTAGLGVTSVENPLEVTDETLFQIGSITKTFTATAIMRLVDMGKLDLDAPVRQYIPDFKVADEAVSAMATVRHLVTHSAGWVGDVFTDTGANDDVLKNFVDQMADLEQLAPPDTLFSYNNAAFVVAGRLIEIVLEKSYEAAMKELIFEPLGLERSFFFARDLLTFRFASGHAVIEEKPRVQRPWAIPRSSNPAGGIVCHIKDLLRYTRFYMGDGATEDGTRLLTPESMQLLQTPQFPINDHDGDIGLSWWIKERNNVKTIEHGGSTLGQQCDMVIAPQKQFAVAILTNGDHGRAPVEAGLNIALKDFLDIEETTPAPIDTTVDQLKEYVGRYERPAMSFDVTLAAGGLSIQMTTKIDLGEEEKAPDPPPINVSIYGEDRFIVTEEGPFKDLRGEFIRNEDGRIGWLRLGARINYRVESGT